MIRVLHLVAGLGKGGAEKQLVLLCAASSQRVEHRVLAARELGFHASALRELGITVDSLGANSLQSPSLLPRLARQIRRARPDILHCWLPSMNLLGALAVRLLFPHRPAVIASVRNVDDWKNPARVAVDRLASRLWDRVLCNSRAGLECARLQGIPEEKLHWVPNGVVTRAPLSSEERERLRAQFGVPAGGILLISACRLVPQKRVDLILSVLDTLRSRYPGLRLLICGDGPLAAALREQAAGLGLSGQVTFTGAVDDPWSPLCAADALIMTSEREGTSNTLLEAMQAGCAIFATPAGDNAALVAGQAGWTGPVSAMSSAVEEAFAQPAILTRYRVAARARAREFSVEKMSAATLGHYEAVLRQPPVWQRALPAIEKGK